MATKLWLSDTVLSDYGSGTNDANLRGTAIAWYSYALVNTQPAGPGFIQQSATAVGQTAIEVEIGSNVSIFWYSAPLAADVTISGSINWNLWAYEGTNAANAAINAQIEKVDGATGAVTVIDKTARTTELGLSVAAANFSETPAAGIACKKGDRLRVRVFAGPVGAGFGIANQWYFTWGGPAAAARDSWVSLTENLTFAAEPAGTTIYPTNTVSDVVTAALDKEAWTSRGAGVQTIEVGSTAGWAAPMQWTDAEFGTVVEWYTKRIAAVTLGGAVRVNARGWAYSQTAIRCEIAVVNADGSSPSVWAAGTLPDELAGAEQVRSFLISGADKAVADGQRLRIRFYTDDPGDQPRISSLAYLLYAGTTAAASGDTWLKFSQTLTQYTALAKTGTASLTGGGIATVAATSARKYVGAAPPGYRDAIMATSGLKGYWRLGESAPAQPAADETGVNPGTYTNDGAAPYPTLGQAGAVGDANTSALWGLGQWIVVPHNASLNLADNWTIEAWLKLSSAGSPDFRAVVSKGDNAYYMRVEHSGYVTLVRSSDWVIATATIPLTAGVWTHVVGTKNGTTVKIYYNGVDRTGTVSNTTATLDQTGEPLLIGADPVPGGARREGFIGGLDEIAVYNRALTITEALDHYNATSGGAAGGLVLTGGGRITATGTTLIAKSGTASLTGGGVVTYAATKKATRTQTMTGGGVITAVPTAGRRAIPVAATGGGVIVVTRTPGRRSAQTLTGGGVITATGVKQDLIAKTGTASLTGGGVVTVARTSTRAYAVPALTGGGVVVAARVAGRRSATTATGGGVVTATRVANRRFVVVATGGGVITTTRTAGRKAQIAATGGGVIVTTGTKTENVVKTGFAVLSGGGVVTVARTSTRSAVATATGGGKISYAYATLSTRTGFASLTGGGTVVVARRSARSAAIAVVGGAPVSMMGTIPTKVSGGVFTVGTAFTANYDGAITHLRYYHTTGHPTGTTHTLSLWTNAGVKLASVADTPPDDLGGYRNVLLALPVPVVAGTTYRVSFTGEGQNYRYDDSGPITSLTPELTASPNGLYSAGTDVFPTSAAANTNFFADVVYARTIGGLGAMTGGGSVSYVPVHAGRRTAAFTGGGVVSVQRAALRRSAAILTGGGVIVPGTPRKGGVRVQTMTGGGIVVVARRTDRRWAVVATGGGVIIATGVGFTGRPRSYVIII